jgi:hypothetical protein
VDGSRKHGNEPSGSLKCWEVGKRTLERPRRRWVDNIKTDLREI